MLKNKSTKKKVNKELLRRPDIYVAALSNKEELTQARSATTGEIFDTLDERIDHEVDRLNKKIEVSFLQQEDKESHVVENSVEGMTTNMVIKGRTLVNLVNSKKIREYVATGAKSDNDTITWDFDNFEIPYNNWNMVYDTLDMCEAGKTYTVIFNVLENTTEVIKTGEKTGISIMNWNVKNGGNTWPEGDYVLKGSGIILKKLTFEKGSLEKSKIAFNVHGKEDVGNTPKRLRGKFVLSKKIMILEGDWTNKEIPSFFEGLKSFGEEEKVEDKYKISILSHGKNLFNVNNSKQGLLNVNTGILFETNTSNTSDYIKVEKGKNYIINGEGGEIRGYYGVLYDCSKRYVAQKTFSKNTPFTFEQDGYFRFSYASKEDGLPATNIIFEEGTQVSAYEPYKEDKKYILLSDLGFDEGLRGLSSTVYDELNNIRNVTIKRIDKYKLTGEEEIYTEETIAENNMKFVITTKGTSVKPSGSVISDNFIKGNDTVSNSVRLATNNKVIINIDKTKLSEHSVEGFKTWLKTNPTTVYYELAEPVETPLDENINVKTFGERTYISFENAISGTSSFKAPVNTVDTIARLNRENRALEEENKTLRQDFESTTLSLTDSDLELVKQNVDMDFRLMEVEFALDIPQAILSSNIKFKNKKGEVKSMARTPYEMMKIVILSGDYDREDYIHKVGKYYERGRMTKEEHDELMSLMTADEVISK